MGCGTTGAGVVGLEV